MQHDADGNLRWMASSDLGQGSLEKGEGEQEVGKREDKKMSKVEEYKVNVRTRPQLPNFECSMLRKLPLHGTG